MTMITLRSDLFERLRQVANQTHVSIQDLADTALDDYLDRLVEQKLEAESSAFTEMHPRLLKEHRGEYVAIHERQVIDSDADFESLFLRVRAHLGQTPILIRQVSESPVTEYRARRTALETVE